MKSLLLVVLACVAAMAQTNPACPLATGSPAHCVDISWSAPAQGSGGTPATYQAYRSTAAGTCVWQPSASGPITPPAGCTKVGTVTVPTTTFTDNSSATNTLTEGTTYFYVLSSANATGESAPSTEVSAKIPLSVPGTPQTPTAVPH